MDISSPTDIPALAPHPSNPESADFNEPDDEWKSQLTERTAPQQNVINGIKPSDNVNTTARTAPASENLTDEWVRGGSPPSSFAGAQPQAAAHQNFSEILSDDMEEGLWELNVRENARWDWDEKWEHFKPCTLRETVWTLEDDSDQESYEVTVEIRRLKQERKEFVAELKKQMLEWRTLRTGAWEMEDKMWRMEIEIWREKERLRKVAVELLRDEEDGFRQMESEAVELACWAQKEEKDACKNEDGRVPEMEETKWKAEVKLQEQVTRLREEKLEVMNKLLKERAEGISHEVNRAKQHIERVEEERREKHLQMREGWIALALYSEKLRHRSKASIGKRMQEEVKQREEEIRMKRDEFRQKEEGIRAVRESVREQQLQDDEFIASLDPEKHARLLQDLQFRNRVAEAKRRVEERKRCAKKSDNPPFPEKAYAWAGPQAELHKNEPEGDSRLKQTQKMKAKIPMQPVSQPLSWQKEIFMYHDALWSRIAVPGAALFTWSDIPWPLMKMPMSPEEISQDLIRAYMQSPFWPEQEKTRSVKDRIKESLKRWHPDRFENRALARVIDSDRERVKVASGMVVRYLNELLRKENEARANSVHT